MLLSKALIERPQDLLQPLVAELLDPLQAVVGQGNSQGLDAAVLLG